MRPQKNGAIAQLVEQRTENPCVPGSNPGGTTKEKAAFEFSGGFFYLTMIFPKTEIFHHTGDMLDAIRSRFGNRRLVVLTDENVSDHCLSLIMEELNSIGDTEVIEIEPGEESKSIDICSHVWNHLLENHIGKQDLLINLGGGVITDLGGFIASTYKRGVPFLNIPTSLLCMTDAAIGGKTGVDHANVKNSVGTYSVPEAIFVCTPFLKTLPDKEITSGFAEMLKHALIGDASLWYALKMLPSIHADSLIPYLTTSILIKEEIVQSDIQEKNLRKLLNFGHTIGHAIESVYLENNQPISHGEVVAMGMLVETKIAQLMQFANEENSNEIIEGISKYFNPDLFNFPSIDKLKPFVLNDKKNEGEKIMMSLVEKPGIANYNMQTSWEIIGDAYRLFRP